MSWLYLITAIVLEVSGTTAMKLSQGFSKILPSALIFVFYMPSLTCLTIEATLSFYVSLFHPKHSF